MLLCSCLHTPSHVSHLLHSQLVLQNPTPENCPSKITTPKLSKPREQSVHLKRMPYFMKQLNYNISPNQVCVLLLFHCIYFLCAHMYRDVCGSQRQLVESVLLPPGESQRLNSGCGAWWQVPVPFQPILLALFLRFLSDPVDSTRCQQPRKQQTALECTRTPKQANKPTQQAYLREIAQKKSMEI